MRSLRALNKRTGSRKAFTLAELLIVVAIIAVLVGISIPIFNAQLEKSREATDIANMRAAKSATVDLYYSEVFDPNNMSVAENLGFTWYPEGNGLYTAWAVYDPNTGGFYSAKSLGTGDKFASMGSQCVAYGQGTKTKTSNVLKGYYSANDYTDCVIIVTYCPKGWNGLTKNCIRIEWRKTNGNWNTNRKDKNYAQIIYFED